METGHFYFGQLIKCEQINGIQPDTSIHAHVSVFSCSSILLPISPPLSFQSPSLTPDAPSQSPGGPPSTFGSSSFLQFPHMRGNTGALSLCV